MQRKIFIVRAFTYALIIIMPSICCAITYTKPVAVRCSSSVARAGWHQIDGEFNKQYTLTTIGMYVKDEDKIVGVWVDRDEANLYANPMLRNSLYDVAYVIAQCVAPGAEPIIGARVDGQVKMYSYQQDPGIPPSFSCPKGYGVAIRFISPNDPDPDRFVYHATLTVTRDDDPETEATVVPADPIPEPVSTTTFIPQVVLTPPTAGDQVIPQPTVHGTGATHIVTGSSRCCIGVRS